MQPKAARRGRGGDQIALVNFFGAVASVTSLSTTPCPFLACIGRLYIVSYIRRSKLNVRRNPEGQLHGYSPDRCINSGAKVMAVAGTTAG